MSFELIFLIGAAVVGIIILANVVRVVPQNEAFIVERLGKFSQVELAQLDSQWVQTAVHPLVGSANT